MLRCLFLIFCLLSVAFWSTKSLPQSADVRKEWGNVAVQPPQQPPPVVSGQAAPVVPPTVVGRGDKVKRCPPDYQEIGKECVKVLRAPAKPQCAPNLQLTPEGTCATYSGKTATCPDGFTAMGSRCERRETATPSQFCAPGFTLADTNECVAPIPPVPEQICTGGSVRRGDLCILEQQENPEVACPPGYTIDGKKCRIEELYNCTPPRPEPTTSTLPPPPPPPTKQSMTPQSMTPQSITPQSITPIRPPLPIYSGKAYKYANRQAPPPTVGAESYRARASLGINFVTRPVEQQPGQSSWRRAQAMQPRLAPPPQSKEFVPELIDYVVQATCKRIRTIPAQKLCARGVLNGKTCTVEVEVPPTTTVPFATEYDVRPPDLQCPAGFALSSPIACLLSQLVDFQYVCPESTQDVGDRCGSFTPPQMVCPSGFTSESDTSCVQTLRAPQLTEFTVRYACMGKNCDK